jgi:Domain of unknown function (DUF4190)
MKICPLCNSTYNDENLFFCLNDGGQLSLVSSKPAPTVFAESSRVTNENWTQYQQNPNWQNQQIYPNQQFVSPTFSVGKNQTLPTVSLIFGIISMFLICCYGGIFIGPVALITGYLGIQNANNEPDKFGGKGMAIAGIILGGISTLFSILFIIIFIISSLAK